MNYVARKCKSLRFWVKEERRERYSLKPYVVKTGADVSLAYCVDLCPSFEGCVRKAMREEVVKDDSL